MSQENPRHFFQLSHKNQHRVRVYRGDTLIADTQDALLLKEVGREIYDGVYYLPMEALKKEFFEGTDLHTTCPIKGEASYLTLKLTDEVLENVAWYYPEPYPKAKRIKDHVAFYGDKVSFRIDPI